MHWNYNLKRAETYFKVATVSFSKHFARINLNNLIINLIQIYYINLLLFVDRIIIESIYLRVSIYLSI